jgi:hypothetical protein
MSLILAPKCLMDRESSQAMYTLYMEIVMGPACMLLDIPLRRSFLINPVIALE